MSPPKQAIAVILGVGLAVAVMLLAWLPLVKEPNYVTRMRDSRLLGDLARAPRSILYIVVILGLGLGGFRRPFPAIGVLLAGMACLCLARQQKDKG
jgi:hypothetical protein